MRKSIGAEMCISANARRRVREAEENKDAVDKTFPGCCCCDVEEDGSDVFR